MRVISGSNSCYKLLDLVTHKEKDMKPFLYDSTVTDPLDVARRDHMEFFVESVIDMKGDPNRKTSLEFLVKWLNYDDKHNTWTRYADLRDINNICITI